MGEAGGQAGFSEAGTGSGKAATYAERQSINTDSRNVWTQILINNLWINNTDFTALKMLHFIHGYFYKIFFLEQSTKRNKRKNRINSNSSINQSLL